MKRETELQERFEAIGEYYSAGFYEEQESSLFRRFARAQKRYLEHYRLPLRHGEPLYPCGSKEQGLAVRPDFSGTIKADWKVLEEKDPAAAEVLKKDVRLYVSSVPAEHSVGGNMYTHSYPNFRRIVREGLDSYELRVRKIADEDIREGLLEVLGGIPDF